MKKLRALSALLAAVALSVAGCSGNGQDAKTSAPAPSAQETTSAAATAAYPATISTKFGDVTVNEKPERVVALGWGDAEVALSLGVQPVGAADWMAFTSTNPESNGVGPWVKNSYEKAPEILGTMELDYEQIAALQPDLILDVKSSGDQERYDRLSKIAPTIGVPSADADNWLTTTDDQVTMIGKALGEPEAAQKQLDETKAAFAEVTKAHPEWDGKTVTVATRTSEGWGAYIDGDARVEFMKNLGLTLNPKVKDLADTSANAFSITVSPEQLDTFDADVIAAFPIFIDSAQITDDAGWKAIPAVSAGHAFVVDGDLASAFSLGTPEATQYAIDKIAPMVESALK